MKKCLLASQYQPRKKIKPKNKIDIYDCVYENCNEKIELLQEVLSCTTTKILEEKFAFPIKKNGNEIEFSISRNGELLSIAIKNLRGYNFGMALNDTFLFEAKFQSFDKEEIRNIFNSHSYNLSGDIEINVVENNYYIYDKKNLEYYIISRFDNKDMVYKERFIVPLYDFQNVEYKWILSVNELVEYGGSLQLYLFWEQKQNVTLLPNNYTPDKFPERICASGGIETPKKHYFYVHYMPQLAPQFMLIVRDYVSWVCAYLEDDKNIELEVNNEPSKFETINACEELEIHKCFLEVSAELLGTRIKKKNNFFFKRIPGDMPYLVKQGKKDIIKKLNIAVQNQNVSIDIIPFQYSEKEYFNQKNNSTISVLKDIANTNYDYFGHNFPTKKPDEINEQLSLLYYLTHHWKFCTPDYIKCYLAHISWLPSFFRDPNSKICKG